MYQEAGVTVPDILHLGPSSFIRECNKVKKIFVFYAVSELHHLYQNDFCFVQNVFVAEDPITQVSSLHCNNQYKSTQIILIRLISNCKACKFGPATQEKCGIIH